MNGVRAESNKRDPLRGLLWGGVALILFTVGRAVDIVPALSGLQLVKVLMVYCTFVLIARRGFLPKISLAENKAVRLAVVFALWIVASFTFSIWPGSSRDFIIQQLPVLALVVVVILSLSGQWPSLRRLFLTLVVSGVILAVPGLLAYGGGRLEVQSTYDTNDLAYVLISIMPMALAQVMTATSRFRRLLGMGAAAIMVLAMILTGSRGGMLGLLAISAIIVLDPGKLKPYQVRTGSLASRRRVMGTKSRIFLSLIAVALVGVVAWPQLPEETRERLSSMLNLGSDYNVNEDVGRVQIWKRGMSALAEQPIGYGISAFPMVDVRYGGRFFTAHNSLVLIAVELGVIGIVLYLAMIARLWGGLTKVRRALCILADPTDQQRQQAVYCRMLQASLAGNLVAGFFLSAAFFYAHWVNIALAMAIIALINRENRGLLVERKRIFRQ